MQYVLPRQIAAGMLQVQGAVQGPMAVAAATAAISPLYCWLLIDKAGYGLVGCHGALSIVASCSQPRLIATC